MATGTLVPLSEADGAIRRPTDSHGKLRYLYWKIVNGALALDDGSTIELGYLPPGQVRLLPRLASLRCSAFGASRVAKIGHKSYYSNDESGGVIADDNDAFSTGLDLSAAAFVANPFGTTIKYDIYGKVGVRLYATITGGTIPAAAEFEGYVPYTYE